MSPAEWYLPSETTRVARRVARSIVNTASSPLVRSEPTAYSVSASKSKAFSDTAPVLVPVQICPRRLPETPPGLPDPVAVVPLE